MDILDGLTVYLMSKSSLTALIQTRLYPENVSQNMQRPYVAFSNTDTERVTHLRGASNIGDFYVQFDIYGSVQDRQNIGEALRNILHTRTNVVLTDSSSNTAVFEYGELNRDYQGEKPQPDGTETVVFCRTMAFSLWIREVIPTLP